MLMPVLGPRLFLLSFEAGPIRLVPKRLMQEGEGLANLEPQAKKASGIADQKKNQNEKKRSKKPMT